MKTAKATALAILFLLIPHQEPRADAPEAKAQPASAEKRSTAVDLRERDGYVWSLAASRQGGDASVTDAGHLQTDGYSWSARSHRSALDPTR